MFISVSTTFVFQFVSVGFVVSVVGVVANLVGRRFHRSLLLMMTLLTLLTLLMLLMVLTLLMLLGLVMLVM